uniref:Uncharacterized protein n=1 Tax=Salix viminalis TaxID=40686 RepID=A0A6N2MQF8_SALVM
MPISSLSGSLLWLDFIVSANEMARNFEIAALLRSMVHQKSAHGGARRCQYAGPQTSIMNGRRIKKSSIMQRIIPNNGDVADGLYNT